VTARRQAMTHQLGPVYHGQGVCQHQEVAVKLTTDESLYDRFSQLSLTRLEDVTNKLDACGGQLQPLDMEEVNKQST